jgi:hypothetical protein
VSGAKLTELVAAFTAGFNAQARNTALGDPRAMNAWDKAKRACSELRVAAATIDAVAREDASRG